jgi:hypothetical protein
MQSTSSKAAVVQQQKRKAEEFVHPAAEEEVTVIDKCFAETSIQQSSPEWSKTAKTGGCCNQCGKDGRREWHMRHYERERQMLCDACYAVRHSLIGTSQANKPTEWRPVPDGHATSEWPGTEKNGGCFKQCGTNSKEESALRIGERVVQVPIPGYGHHNGTITAINLSTTAGTGTCTVAWDDGTTGKVASDTCAKHVESAKRQKVGNGENEPTTDYDIIVIVDDDDDDDDNAAKEPRRKMRVRDDAHARARAHTHACTQKYALAQSFVG